MTRKVWDQLLGEMQTTFRTHLSLQKFCPFPDDVRAQDVAPFYAPCASYFANETGLSSDGHSGLQEALRMAGPHAHWRETYKGTDIGQDFMDRFGCYAIIGPGGAFISAQMFAFVVFMPKGLYYPFHHHPAEEMYFVLAGQAEFMREGEANETLREGDTSFHASNQSHAMETHEHPVLALVFWRNAFETPPVLS